MARKHRLKENLQPPCYMLLSNLVLHNIEKVYIPETKKNLYSYSFPIICKDSFVVTHRIITFNVTQSQREQTTSCLKCFWHICVRPIWFCKCCTSGPCSVTCRATPFIRQQNTNKIICIPAHLSAWRPAVTHPGVLVLWSLRGLGLWVLLLKAGSSSSASRVILGMSAMTM